MCHIIPPTLGAGELYVPHCPSHSMGAGGLYVPHWSFTMGAGGLYVPHSRYPWEQEGCMRHIPR